MLKAVDMYKRRAVLRGFIHKDSSIVNKLRLYKDIIKSSVKLNPKRLP